MNEKKEYTRHFCNEMQLVNDDNYVAIKKEVEKWMLYVDDGGHVNGAVILVCPYCGEVLDDSIIKKDVDVVLETSKPKLVPSGVNSLYTPKYDRKLHTVHEEMDRVMAKYDKPCELETIPPNLRMEMLSASTGGIEPNYTPCFIRKVPDKEELAKLLAEASKPRDCGGGMSIKPCKSSEDIEKEYCEAFSEDFKRIRPFRPIEDIPDTRGVTNAVIQGGCMPDMNEVMETINKKISSGCGVGIRLLEVTDFPTMDAIVKAYSKAVEESAMKSLGEVTRKIICGEEDKK